MEDLAHLVTARLNAFGEMLWRPLCPRARSTSRRIRLAPSAFARVLGEMFVSGAAGAAVALPLKPLNLMHAEPARAFIESRGGEVRTGAAARVLCAPVMLSMLSKPAATAGGRMRSWPPCRGSGWPACSTASLRRWPPLSIEPAAWSDRQSRPSISGSTNPSSNEPFVGLQAVNAMGVRQADDLG